MRASPPPVASSPPATPARPLDRVAALAIALWSAAMLAVALIAHRTPLYGVETDLLGDYAPAARELLHGVVRPERFEFHGPGYPALLAVASPLAGGDPWIAARILNVVAAAIAAWCAYRLTQRFLGAPVAVATVLALLAMPVFVRATIEAATDMPSLALSFAATWLALAAARGRGLLLAGLLAGFAYLTRDNALFLVPAAAVAIAARPGRGRAALAYGAGWVLPVAAWIATQLAVSGHPFANKNHLNLAFEIYGGGMAWDRFWIETGAAFHSFLDVVRFDPARFAAHVGANLATRWLDDARRLMPVWIGALALPGLAVTWWRRPGWAAFLAPPALCYAVLCFVFYSPRFFLFLLPFYLSGACALLIGAEPQGAIRPPEWLRRVGPWAAAALIAVSAVAAARENRALLADAPDEVRAGGEALRRIARPGDAVLARKPHVAWFAGMDYVAVPYADAFTDFLDAVHATRARYLFVSPIEMRLQPQLSVLEDPDVHVPGLEPIAWRGDDPRHGFAIYRLVPSTATAAVVDESLLVAIRRFAARRPGEPWPATYLGGQLVTMGRFREALAPLAEAARLSPGDALVARFQAIASFETGDLETAGAAAERALQLTGAGASWEEGYLGHVRLAQGRLDEARAHLMRAMRAAPGAARYAEEFRVADSLARARGPTPRR
ncbi:MAG: glycosyltransferase family 39 protein [Candidatus Eisenbacteria bacterium]|nr:glycosyltransferase family 39 protein [Candidatus Eisenbacteria bacterium]